MGRGTGIGAIIFGLAGIAVAQAGTMFFGGLPSGIEHRLRAFEFVRAAEIGNTSLGFRLEDATGPVAAFRPLTRSSPRGFLGDLAAYEIANVLSFDNTPPCVRRSVTEAALSRRLASAGSWNRLDEELADGSIDGAMCHWVAGMRDEHLESEEAMSEWSGWLRLPAQPIPAGKEELARDLSNAIVFDYLIANGDRYSGGNLRTLDVDGHSRLVLRDHNLAFGAAPQGARLLRLSSTLERVQRFSRATLQRLSAQTFADNQPLREFLSGDELRDLQARRATVLSYVAAQIRVHGSEAVLAFP